MQTVVHRIASLSSPLIGSARALVLACGVVVGFIAFGLWLGFSDRWLAISSSVLSTVTFLLVFLLQYREDRHTAAIQLKLNELLRAVEGAREHELLDFEHLAEAEQEHVSRRLRHPAPAVADD